MSTDTTDKTAAAEQEARAEEQEKEARPAAQEAAAQEAAAQEAGEREEVAAVEEASAVEETGREEKRTAGKSITIAIPMPGRVSLARILLVLLLAAAVAAAGWQWRHAADLEGRERAREDISSVAGQFGQALLSYRHGDLTEARQKVLALATPDFGKTYEVAFTETLQSTILELKADATATVRVVYVSGGADGAARAVVVMDSQVKSTAGTRNVTGSYLQMDLVELKGSWKVSAVNSIGAINESLAAVPTTEPSPKPSTP